MKAFWSSGDCAALVWADSAALVSPRLGDDAATRLWAGCASESLPQFLEALGEELQVGLLSLPDFAVIYTGADFAHVACRGSFIVVVTHDDGEDELSGADVTTWAERRTPLASVRRIELRSAQSSPGSLLPVTGGIVRAAALTIGEPVLRGSLDAHGALRGGGVKASGVAGTAGQRNAEPGPSPLTLVEESMASPLIEDPLANHVHEPVEDEVELAGESAEGASEPVAGDVVGDDQGDGLDDHPQEVSSSSRFSALLADHTYAYDIEQAAVRRDDLSESEGGWHEDPGNTSLASIPEPMPVDDPPPPAVADEGEAAGAGGSGTESFISVVPDFASSDEPEEAAPSETPRQANSGQGVETDDLDLSYHDDLTFMGIPDESLEAHAEPASPIAGGGSKVRGLVCPQGHGNPPQRVDCRVCNSRLDGDVVEMERPPLGWLHTSAGKSLQLVTTILAGRAPRASKFQGTDMPQLLPLPHGHVSSTHVEIKIEGWSVLAHDLGSTNGTFLQREGQPTMRLSETPHLLASNDVLNLGHGVTLRFEELP